MNRILELNEEIAHFSFLATLTRDEIARSAIQDMIAEIEAELQKLPS